MGGRTRDGDDDEERGSTLSLSEVVSALRRQKTLVLAVAVSISTLTAVVVGNMPNR